MKEKPYNMTNSISHDHIAGCVEFGPYLVVMKMCKSNVVHALILHIEGQMHSGLKMSKIYLTAALASTDYPSMMT